MEPMGSCDNMCPNWVPYVHMAHHVNIKGQEEETLLKEQKRREKEEAETRKQHKITFPVSVSTNEITTEF